MNNRFIVFKESSSSYGGIIDLIQGDLFIVKYIPKKMLTIPIILYIMVKEQVVTNKKSLIIKTYKEWIGLGLEMLSTNTKFIVEHIIPIQCQWAYLV